MPTNHNFYSFYLPHLEAPKPYSRPTRGTHLLPGKTVTYQRCANIQYADVEGKQVGLSRRLLS